MTSWPWMSGISEAVTSEPIDPVTEHDVRPRVTDLIEKYREKIDKVKEEVSKDPLYDKDKHDDLWIMRFYMSHKKSKPAIAAAKSTLAFRAKYKLDEKDIRDTPPHKTTEGPTGIYNQTMPKEAVRFTIPDKQRGVVAFMHIAIMNNRELVDNVSAEDWIHPFLYLTEWTHQWVDYITRTTGLFTKTVRLLDINAVGITTIPRESIKRDSNAMAVMEDAYPQLLETIYLCFPGIVFHITWNLARPLLPKRLIEKMDVIHPVKSEHERKRLLRHIKMEDLPEKFGGSAKHYSEWDDVVSK